MARPRQKRAKQPKQVETFTHDERRANIPNAEDRSLMDEEELSPIRVAYERRNPDLDPQLVWRGKDSEPLEVQAPPLYIQERVHPQALIADLMRFSDLPLAGGDAEGRGGRPAQQLAQEPDMFADFNGLPEGADRTDFYEHDANWSNRMILGDSLQVMASLAEREGLRGKVQCIYLDPPYGIKFNSNFQWSTTSRDVRDGNAAHITREPEQVRAFRDTWRDGIHSYLSYLRDRLEIARDLLTDSGSIFVQIGDENVHRVRAVVEEVFGQENVIAEVVVSKTTSATAQYLAGTCDYLIWAGKSHAVIKYRQPFRAKQAGEEGAALYNRLQSVDGAHVQPIGKHEDHGDLIEKDGWHIVTSDNLVSQSGGETTRQPVEFRGEQYKPGSGGWKTNAQGMKRLKHASRVTKGGRALRYVRRLSDFRVSPIANLWQDMLTGSFTEQKLYVVQTAEKLIQRCILMTTDPGDLVLDPTCGSGTTAYVAEQWGRRWITIDTSRVALALARARIMGARYLYYLLSDSADGQAKEAEISSNPPSDAPAYGDLRQGFVYERVPHITLRDIANNAEIDVIWERYQAELEPLRELLNDELGHSVDESWEEWEIPREADESWPDFARECHADWWELRIERQREIDASISRNAAFEYLYDKPYEDKRKVRVAGPFTVESLSPHRVLGVDEDDELIDPRDQMVAESNGRYDEPQDFASVMLDNLRRAGVQQAHKEDKIEFSALTPWPGHFICAEGRYEESGQTRRAGIFIGPEFGTVSRPDLFEAARETAEAGFDALIACAFNYEAHTTEFSKLGRIPVLKARMNPDLHMADELKNTGSGNLFVIFGEPDIDIFAAEPQSSPSSPSSPSPGGTASSPFSPSQGEMPKAEGASPAQLQVRVNGVDVFDPSRGEVRSDGPDGIACWFIDTDYNGESFFVRHAYFLGANDPYKSLKTTLKAEIDEEAWSTLHSDTSRPFDPPESGRIAVKVINHLGDEVMKVFRVP